MSNLDYANKKVKSYASERAFLPTRITLILFSLFHLSSAFTIRTPRHVSSRSINPIKSNKKDETGGYKFGDVSRNLAKKFTKSVEGVTGKPYKFGDLTRHLDKKSKEKGTNVAGGGNLKKQTSSRKLE